MKFNLKDWISGLAIGLCGKPLPCMKSPSMISGWLLGLRIAWQRASKKTPAGYLTFASAEAFTVGVNNATKNWDGTLYYSTDAATWNEWDGTTAIASAEHDGEQRIYIRGRGNTVITGGSYGHIANTATNNWILTGSDIRCVGNIENLLDYESVANGEHPVMADDCFSTLFYECRALTVAPELPAAILSGYCYTAMFYGCIGLTTAPELPATTLDFVCYERMFYGCTGLTEAPKLPATSLIVRCYDAMFYGCTGLIKAPELPATTLANSCYNEMFYGCTSLTTAPALPATTLAEFCYDSMFAGCVNLLTIPILPATELPSQCYQYMFSGCTGLKFSETQSDEYPNAYRIPASGDGTYGLWALSNMFRNTGGTFTGTPSINTTYYTSNEVV